MLAGRRGWGSGLWMRWGEVRGKGDEREVRIRISVSVSSGSEYEA